MNNHSEFWQHVNRRKAGTPDINKEDQKHNRAYVHNGGDAQLTKRKWVEYLGIKRDKELITKYRHQEPEIKRRD